MLCVCVCVYIVKVQCLLLPQSKSCLCWISHRQSRIKFGLEMFKLFKWLTHTHLLSIESLMVLQGLPGVCMYWRMNVQKPARSHPADGITEKYHMVAGFYKRVSNVRGMPKIWSDIFYTCVHNITQKERSCWIHLHLQIHIKIFQKYSALWSEVQCVFCFILNAASGLLKKVFHLERDRYVFITDCGQ